MPLAGCVLPSRVLVKSKDIPVTGESPSVKRRLAVRLIQQAMDEGTYPIAGRHSSQSWQERFKKNGGAFSRRVRRLVDEGVNNTLKTNQERNAERVKRAKIAAGQPIGEYVPGS